MGKLTQKNCHWHQVSFVAAFVSITSLLREHHWELLNDTKQNPLLLLLAVNTHTCLCRKCRHRWAQLVPDQHQQMRSVCPRSTTLLSAHPIATAPAETKQSIVHRLGPHIHKMRDASHREQVRLVSVKAERPKHPSRCHQAGVGGVSPRG